MTTGKAIALTIWTFVGKVTSLLFNMLSRFVIANLDFFLSPIPNFTDKRKAGNSFQNFLNMKKSEEEMFFSGSVSLLPAELLGFVSKYSLVLIKKLKNRKNQDN